MGRLWPSEYDDDRVNGNDRKDRDDNDKGGDHGYDDDDVDENYNGDADDNAIDGDGDDDDGAHGKSLPRLGAGGQAAICGPLTSDLTCTLIILSFDPSSSSS